mmetsp:Transcript_18329/g.55180  ORF Transcript_18329/g.55180 Transcript_18329/m.55180 type:complete len:98 (-) Transcript_18329:2851-3144(-)
MDDYSRNTIRLLLERYPKYLSEILLKLGFREVVSSDTPDTIVALISHQENTNSYLPQSSIYVCRCGSKQVVTRELQTRSTDEGSTIVHICSSCGLIY